MKLAVGSVQFGLDYGVVNRDGRVPEAEAGRILSAAQAAGADLVDTAPAYGDAEVVLGRLLNHRPDMRVVTKTTPVRVDAAQEVREGLAASLRRLDRGSVYGLLVHRTQDLLGAAGDSMWEALVEARDAGKVERIGVSVYGADEIAAIRRRYPIQLVQLPFSVLDQRLLNDGTLATLHDEGVEVHARSVLLQGIVAADLDALDARFAAARAPLLALERWALERGATRLAIAISFAVSRPEIDRVVIGVTSAAALDECIAASRLSLPPEFQRGRFAVHDEAILNPSKWPSVARH